jgi:hypothetical protein
MRMSNVKAATTNVNGATFYVRSAVSGWGRFGLHWGGMACLKGWVRASHHQLAHFEALRSNQVFKSKMELDGFRIDPVASHLSIEDSIDSQLLP